MNRIDPRRLETFRAVAQCGRVSAAAKRLHLSQPAVTAQVRQLEDECGTALFIRSNQGMALNDAGQRLLAYANRVGALLDEAAASMRADQRAGATLVLAASQTTAAYVVPRLVAGFRRHQPDLSVRVEVGNTAQVLEWLAAGTVPLGTVEGLPRAPRMRLEPFLQDELLPVVASDAPAPLQRLACAEDFARVPIIWREVGSGSRAVVERAFQLAGARRPPHPGDLSLGSNDAVRTAVSLGLGVAFLSKWTIPGELAAGRLRPLELVDLRIQRSFAWAIPAGHVGGIAGEFLQGARRMAAEWWPALGVGPRRRGEPRPPRRASGPP